MITNEDELEESVKLCLDGEWGRVTDSIVSYSYHAGSSAVAVALELFKREGGMALVVRLLEELDHAEERQ